MFCKILIANRGEIAVRIIRVCRDLGISPVAVFSEADANALHVRMSDEAYCIGPAPSNQSYLNISAIVDTAKRAGAEAIHPGYGFLAENAAFARAVADAGLTFIGPSPQAMEIMGSKTSARRAAVEANVPVVPGTTESLPSYEAARATAARFGYPVMLKAAAGGGGKGMRQVAQESELLSAFEAAQSEAAAAFGNPEIYLEKLVERPRHIEIQIFADSHGNCVHLGERECSIQRRHQKVIEECPSPLDDSSLRERMGASAIRIAQAVGYVGAGTVEFLFSDATREFYFLEMNTRLQVEHPVTELVTGLDLVREQFTVADGAPLSFDQGDVGWRGHAIECRVYAEDPDNNFFPSPGRISFLRVPAGPGIRDDSGVSEGDEVSIYYDPMISKLAAWGRTRTEAIERLRRALDEYAVGGIKTTLPFFREIVRDEEFIAGRLDTGFITRFNQRRSQERPHPASGAQAFSLPQDIAIIAAALAYARAQRQTLPNHQPAALSKWKRAGRAAAVAREPVRRGSGRR
jgi:acetyl-CoA carboxylase, biotin carboxylase subunit